MTLQSPLSWEPLALAASLVIVAYLVGSVSPSSVIVRRRLGRDIRQMGDGNAGAENVCRLVGIKPAVLVATIDISKGLLVVLVTRWLSPHSPMEHPLAGGRRIQLDNILPLGAEAANDIAPGGPCPFLGREAWVSAEGRFDPCCAPDAQRRTLGDFGNLHERGLMDIWNGEAYRSLVATYRNRDLCIGCNMRRPAGTP